MKSVYITAWIANSISNLHVPTCVLWYSYMGNFSIDKTDRHEITEILLKGTLKKEKEKWEYTEWANKNRKSKKDGINK